jgi:DNA-binding transcriptional regulator LsrR (DeoR family)
MFNLEIQKKIVEFIKKGPIGVTSSDIANNFNLNRMTITKYLAIIKEKALIDFKQFGMAKLWYIPVKLTKESFFSKIVTNLAANMKEEEFKTTSEKAGISLGEEINQMYLNFNDVKKLTLPQLADAYEDVGNKLGGRFKAQFTLEKISVEILQSPFDENNTKTMNKILAAVLAKMASLNLGYARAIILEPNERENIIIDVYLKKTKP